MTNMIRVMQKPQRITIHIDKKRLENKKVIIYLPNIFFLMFEDYNLFSKSKNKKCILENLQVNEIQLFFNLWISQRKRKNRRALWRLSNQVWVREPWILLRIWKQNMVSLVLLVANQLLSSHWQIGENYSFLSFWEENLLWNI